MGYSTEFRGQFGLNKKLDEETYDFLVKFSETRHDGISTPNIWCNWTPTDDRKGIEWNGAEKFYNYIEWIEYLIAEVFAPKGYVLSGDVEWVGDDIFDDQGIIRVVDNLVKFRSGMLTKAVGTTRRTSPARPTPR